MDERQKSAMERWRCLAVGCNPKLRAHNAQQHAEAKGHRVAKWPVRSAAGEAKQSARNRLNPYRPYLSDYVREHTANRDDEAMSEYEDSKEGN